MKKQILPLMLCVLLLSALLAGCRNEPESLPYGAHVESSSSQKTTSTEENTSQTTGSSTSAANTSSEPEVLEEHSVTGTIDDVAMGQVFVLLDSGKVVPFDYTTADISNWNDTKPGAKIRVYYTGTFSGTDTSTIKVTRLENA